MKPGGLLGHEFMGEVVKVGRLNAERAVRIMRRMPFMLAHRDTRLATEDLK
jgi:threonine dehydrogenase-like Zn-dependent dehydrogenase